MVRRLAVTDHSVQYQDGYVVLIITSQSAKVRQVFQQFMKEWRSKRCVLSYEAGPSADDWPVPVSHTTRKGSVRHLVYTLCNSDELPDIIRKCPYS